MKVKAVNLLTISKFLLKNFTSKINSSISSKYLHHFCICSKTEQSHMELLIIIQYTCIVPLLYIIVLYNLYIIGYKMEISVRC